jgi:hypothetical protein
MTIEICRINTIQRSTTATWVETYSRLNTQLRACRQDLAVTKAALSEVRAVLSSTHGLLERFRDVLEAKKVKIPEGLETYCRALMGGDPCEIRTASSATAFDSGELNAQQTINADAKEDQHGKRAWPPHLSTISPTVDRPMPPSRLNHRQAIASINSESSDTQLSQAATRESSAATEPFVSKEGAAGAKRGAIDGDLNSAKRLKTARLEWIGASHYRPHRT